MTVGHIRANKGEQRFLEKLQAELRSGAYRPSPSRRILIPKAGKPGQFRPLGIPTIKDRVAQGAVKLLLEPIFEAQFWHVSYGFRPGRSSHGALEYLRRAALPQKRDQDNRRSRLPYPASAHAQGLAGRINRAVFALLDSSLSVPPRLVGGSLTSPCLLESRMRNESRKSGSGRGGEQTGRREAIRRLPLLLHLILDWRLLGYGHAEGNDPYQAITSKTKQSRYNQEMNAKAAITSEDPARSIEPALCSGFGRCRQYRRRRSAHRERVLATERRPGFEYRLNPVSVPLHLKPLPQVDSLKLYSYDIQQ